MAMGFSRSVLRSVWVLIAWLTAGAAMADATDSGRIDGTLWQLAELPGAELLPGVAVTLGFADGHVQGSDGCNRYRVPYSAEDDRFVLTGNGMSTMMACPPPVMRQADAFSAALRSAQRLRSQGDRLELLDAGGAAVAVFVRESQALPGTRWQVTGYNNGKQAVVSVLSGTALTLAFAPDGRLSGSAGCNRFQAGYSTGDGQVRIGPAASTRKMCPGPDGLMQQEALFLQALEGTHELRIEGGRLELRAAGGALQVSAKRLEDRAAASGLALPATFRGDLPCADCEAIRHHLDLWPDRVFHLHREWVGRPARGGDGHFAVDRIGRWRIDPARDALILQGGDETPLQFEIKDVNLLRALDIQGRPIDSALPYELRSDGTLVPRELHLSLGGELRYMADAAQLTECLTGRGYPVAFEADWIALERAYRETVAEPGGRLYVTFDGALAARPKMDGAGTETTVVVERFVNVWPNMRCERARANASLVNTYWRIARLGDAPVTAAAGQREPHVLLRSADGQAQYRATVGCNQLGGGLAVDGDRIRFDPGPATLMACPPPLDELERRLVDALERASRWHIEANTLELFDAAGAPVALLEVVYF